MTPLHFRRCLQLLYGQSFVASAAAELDIRTDKIQRMVAGRELIYPDTARRVVALVKARGSQANELLRELEGLGPVENKPQD